MRTYAQADVDVLLAEHQAQLAMLSERAANYALAAREAAEKLAGAATKIRELERLLLEADAAPERVEVAAAPAKAAARARGAAG